MRCSRLTVVCAEEPACEEGGDAVHRRHDHVGGVRRGAGTRFKAALCTRPTPARPDGPGAAPQPHALARKYPTCCSRWLLIYAVRDELRCLSGRRTQRVDAVDARNRSPWRPQAGSPALTSEGRCLTFWTHLESSCRYGPRTSPAPGWLRSPPPRSPCARGCR